MNIQFHKLLIFTALLLVGISCTEDDYSKQLEKWKTENDNYYLHMKDSAAFQLFQNPIENGGGSYYYKIITPGDANAESPAATDLVTVNYKGMLINGTVFDSTYSGQNPLTDTSAKPVQFSVNQLISGWVVNLQQMKPGEVRTIVLPYDMGYGIYGVGSVILPYSTLRFDMHLISVKKTIVE